MGAFAMFDYLSPISLQCELAPAREKQTGFTGVLAI
jgi:hypothetical protein